MNLNTVDNHMKLVKLGYKEVFASQDGYSYTSTFVKRFCQNIMNHVI